MPTWNVNSQEKRRGFSFSCWSCSPHAAEATTTVAWALIGPGEVLPGNVSVDNRTPWDVEVAWLWVGEDGEAQVRRVSVPAGQVMGLTDAPLAAGAQLTLDLVLLVPPETGPRVRRKAEVRVDGDRIVVVQASADDPFGVDVSISG